MKRPDSYSSWAMGVVAVAVCVALAPAVASAVSPSPQLLERAGHDAALAAALARESRAAAAKGIDAPSVDRVVVTLDAEGVLRAQVVGAPAAAGQLKSLAILVDFPDRAAQVPASFFDSLLFADVYGPASLRGYFKEASYGTLDLTTANLPSSVGWVRLSHPATYYAGLAYGMGTYPQNSQHMVEDAVALVDSVVDFSQYDGDGDTYVDNLMIVHAGSGAEMTARTSDIWSHKASLPSALPVDGVWVGPYSTEPEFWLSPGDMTTGVYAHEVGHILGLPDLYDRDGSSSGVGNWSLMGAGSWNGWLGNSPARPDAWSSGRAGWLQPTTITEIPRMRDVPAVSSAATGTAYRLYPNGASSGAEYFLVENRQMTGTDSRLPGAGLLVWHIDETRSNNDDEARRLVDLEEADGLADLDAPFVSGTAGDPFPGTSWNLLFNESTNPGSMTYAGGAGSSNIYVGSISDSRSTMTARIGVGDPNVHTITPVIVGAGYLTPGGVQVVDEGATMTLTFSPGPLCRVEDVLVDGGSVGAVSSYTFGSVSADHTITVTFDLARPRSTWTSIGWNGVLRRRRPVMLYGAVTPGFKGDTVAISARAPGSRRWYRIATVVADQPNGGWAYTVRPARRGYYYFRASFGGGHNRTSSSSEILKVRIR